MKISYKLDYALKTILNLAIHYKQDLVTIQDLSQRLDIPKKFLEQILLELKKGGFVDSKRGNIGGYFLAKKPETIKIGDIVRYIDGPIEPIDCLDNHYLGCKDIPSCVFRKIWIKVNQATANIIDHITLENVIYEYKRLNQISEYSI